MWARVGFLLLITVCDPGGACADACVLNETLKVYRTYAYSEQTEMHEASAQSLYEKVIFRKYHLIDFKQSYSKQLSR
jgi:hypothetical protein